MKSLYHPTAYDLGQTADSYWEASAGPRPSGCVPLGRDERCDVAVIGGGYTGLSAALHLARDHDADVRVLEAGPPGWGASGRNGGFCCIGAAKLSARRMIARFGLEETQRFYASQRQAVALVDDLAESEGIAIDRRGDGILRTAHAPSRASRLKAEAAFDAGTLGLPCRYLSPDELAEYGFAGREAHGALHWADGFGLHPLKYLLGLTDAAMRRGASVHAGSPVTAWERRGRDHRLITPGGSVTAARVIIATNGYTADSLHPRLAGALLPVISSIITTRPLTPGERAACGWSTATPLYDTRHLLHYFRLLPDGRILVGTRGDTSGRPVAMAGTRRRLTRWLARVLPALDGIEISHAWSGLVCLSTHLTPLIGRFADDPGVHYGLAFHGNGVAGGTWTGRALAELVASGRPVETLLPAVVARPPRRFPLPLLRRWYLRAAYAGYRLADAL